MYRNIPIDLNHILDIGVDKSMSWSRVSFASCSTLSFPSLPQRLGIQQKLTCAINAEEVHDMANESILNVFTLN